MTYIVGWKYDGHAFLCADALLTRTNVRNSQLHKTYSAFGELHINTEQKSTKEGLKFCRLPEGQGLVEVCGSNYDLALEIATEFSFERSGTADAHTALRSALKRFATELQVETINLIVVVPQKTDVALLAYDGNQDFDIHEYGDGDFVQFGSMPDTFKGVTAEAISVLKQIHAQIRFPPRSQLACMLSILQSYGVDNYLIDEGVGGAYCGAYASPDEIKWQDDIGFYLYRRGFDATDVVSCCVREDVVFVYPRLREYRHFYNDTAAGSPIESVQKWHPYVLGVASLNCFDFMTFISVGKRTVTVIEMNKQIKTKYLAIDIYNPTLTGSCKFEFAPRPLKAITEAHLKTDKKDYAVTLNFFTDYPPPFTPPQPKE